MGTTLRISELATAEHSALCAASPGGAVPYARAVQTRPLAWGAGALWFLHRGRIVRVAADGLTAGTVVTGGPLGAGPFSPGSNVSAGGIYLAVPGTDGALVRDGTGHWRSWYDPQLGGMGAQLTDLVVSDDGRTAAGLVGTQLWVMQHDVMALAPPTMEPARTTAAPVP